MTEHSYHAHLVLTLSCATNCPEWSSPCSETLIGSLIHSDEEISGPLSITIHTFVCFKGDSLPSWTACNEWLRNQWEMDKIKGKGGMRGRERGRAGGREGGREGERLNLRFYVIQDFRNTDRLSDILWWRGFRFDIKCSTYFRLLQGRLLFWNLGEGRNEGEREREGRREGRREGGRKGGEGEINLRFYVIRRIPRLPMAVNPSLVLSSLVGPS